MCPNFPIHIYFSCNTFVHLNNPLVFCGYVYLFAIAFCIPNNQIWISLHTNRYLGTLQTELCMVSIIATLSFDPLPSLTSCCHTNFAENSMQSVYHHDCYLYTYFCYELWRIAGRNCNEGGRAAYGWRETDWQSGTLEEFRLTNISSGQQVVPLQHTHTHTHTPTHTLNIIRC